MRGAVKMKCHPGIPRPAPVAASARRGLAHGQRSGSSGLAAVAHAATVAPGAPAAAGWRAAFVASLEARADASDGAALTKDLAAAVAALARQAGAEEGAARLGAAAG
jgi:hypothetical protein